MKLYYSPGACSLSPHIALHEAGLPFTAVLASTKSHKLADGTDYYTINPLGYVPLLELDDGATRIHEGPAIVQYIADQVPDKKLAPPNGTLERTRLQSLLNFVSSEIHKGYSPLFNAAMPEEAKALFRQRLRGRYEWVERQLADGRAYLMGETFTVADGYLFTCTRWAGVAQVDLSGLDHLAAYMQRVQQRPAVQAALRAEGLLK